MSNNNDQDSENEESKWEMKRNATLPGIPSDTSNRNVYRNEEATNSQNTGDGNNLKNRDNLSNTYNEMTAYADVYYPSNEISWISRKIYEGSTLREGSERLNSDLLTSVKSSYYSISRPSSVVNTPMNPSAEIVSLTVVDSIATPANSTPITLGRNTLGRKSSVRVKRVRDGAEMEIPLSNPNQFRAFSRRAISYQKRQWFENICCIGLCPLLMVLLTFILKIIISQLSSNGSQNFQVMYCSNKNSLNEQNWPVYNLTSPNIAKDEKFHYVNFLSRLSLVDLTGRDPVGQLVAAAIAGSLPCAQWFGEDYPKDASNQYAQPTNYEKAYSNKDSLYTSEIKNGWLDVLSGTNGGSDLNSLVARQALSLLRTFVSYQTRPWYTVATGSNVQASYLGSAPQQPVLENATQIPGTDVLYFKTANQANGILDTIEPRFYVLATASPPALKGFQQVPFFQQNYTTLDSLSDAYTQRISDAIVRLKNVSTVDQRLYKSFPDLAIAQTVFGMQAAVEGIPFAGLYFSEINHDQKKYAYTMQVGTNDAIANVQGFPVAGLRAILLQSQLSNGLLRFSGPSQSANLITQGTMAFPYVQPSQLEVPFESIIGRILYPLGISFLLPIFTLALVKDKENRILVMLRMNGMGDVTGYYISTYVTFYINYCISSAIFMITGYVTGLDLFTKTASGIIIILLLLWGHVQVCLSFIFSAIFRSSSVATVLVFILTVCGVVTSYILDQIFVSTTSFPLALYLWPPFLFYRILDLLNRHAISTALVPYTFKLLVPGNIIFTSLIILAAEVIILLLLAIYLTQTLPTTYGIPRPWYFPVTDFLAWLKSEKEFGAKIRKFATDPKELEKEDEDVMAERVRILNGDFPANAPVIIQGMRKQYGTGSNAKIAVKDATFVVENNTVFGLLGPNGAGKTSLISILTGIYPPTSGTATLAGFCISEEPDLSFRSIGVCPQFDILWSELTVEEHLYFYARLKGVVEIFEDEAVAAALDLIQMTHLRTRIIKGLSGGERRRVSIAIALVSNPKVVFLDEPTTGLDPEVRRSVWDTIARARGNRAILMTTHSMEEAEVCCQRIGIMAKGIMRCLGSPARLKSLYGSGYKLSINSSNFTASDKFLEEILPVNFCLISSFHSSRRYSFAPIGDQLAHIFDELVSKSASNGILSWGVSQTSLDEIFSAVISVEEASS